MYNYDIDGFREVASGLIGDVLTADVLSWLSDKSDITNTAAFNAAFAMMPRKTGKAIIAPTEQQAQALTQIIPAFDVSGWTIDRLCRVWLLVEADASDKEQYFKTVENLFLAGEMNELVALYSALPLLPYPELWVHRCTEGIRSNIGSVLEAVMYHNVYPSQYLSESAWNQLVMKAIFTEKDLNKIVGLATRNNPELARILFDFANERGAAGRTVDPMLWQLASAFIDDNVLNAVKQQYSTL